MQRFVLLHRVHASLSQNVTGRRKRGVGDGLQLATSELPLSCVGMGTNGPHYNVELTSKAQLRPDNAGAMLLPAKKAVGTKM